VQDARLDDGLTVGDADEALAVRTEGLRLLGGRRVGTGEDGLSALGIPGTDFAFGTGGDDPCAVGAEGHAGDYDYLVCVNPAVTPREKFELYPRRLRERLPRVRIPLAEGDKGVVLDLQEVLAQTYEAGTYAEMLNYDAPCVPPLPPDDQLWANECIRQAREGPPAQP
jgi:hypothetical protein